MAGDEEDAAAVADEVRGESLSKAEGVGNHVHHADELCLPDGTCQSWAGRHGRGADQCCEVSAPYLDAYPEERTRRGGCINLHKIVWG